MAEVDYVDGDGALLQMASSLQLQTTMTKMTLNHSINRYLLTQNPATETDDDGALLQMLQLSTRNHSPALFLLVITLQKQLYMTYPR